MSDLNSKPAKSKTATDLAPIKDARATHWVYRAPKALRPYLQLARYDRPIGYWLLALPCFIGLAFAGICYGLSWGDLKWASLLFIGSIAMRGAGCTYNDIIDRKLDAKVDRTALRPIPAGTVSVRKALIWTGLQCVVGLGVLLSLPNTAQIIALCAVPLVAAYPFMKRITWWPQAWLGLTFNWGILVGYAIKTGFVSLSALCLYLGAMLWTISYDTLYACQDIEDDALIGVKSTARLFGDKLQSRLLSIHFLWALLTVGALQIEAGVSSPAGLVALPILLHLSYQRRALKQPNPNYLALFKSNFWAGWLFILSLLIFAGFTQFTKM